MKSGVKGFLMGVLVTSILFGSIALAGNLKVGDIIGNVLYSDVVTYYEGQAVPCFNVDGKIGLYVTELRNMGFNVVWNATERAVYILPTDTNYNEVDNSQVNSSQSEDEDTTAESIFAKDIIVLYDNYEDRYIYWDREKDIETISFPKAWPFIGDYALSMTDDGNIIIINKDLQCVWQSDDLIEIADDIINTDVANMSTADFAAMLSQIASPEADSDVEIYFAWLSDISDKYLSPLYQYDEAMGEEVYQYMAEAVDASISTYNKKMKAFNRAIDAQSALQEYWAKKAERMAPDFGY